MDQFVTTYRKDFLWPYIRSFGLRPDNGPQHTSLGDHGDMCECQCHRQAGPREEETGQKMIGPNVYKQETFQKQGPSLPLMEPTMFPARVGPPPQGEAQRFNQPNVFLDKLKLKYPFLYEILKTASPEDVVTKINKDRLRTTYQVDFCHLNEYPSGPYDDLLRAAGLKGTETCNEPVRLPGDPCRPNQKPLGFKPGVMSSQAKDGSEKCGGGGGFGGSGPASNLKAIVAMGSTEYQDAISKLGELIIRDKIHYRRPK